MKYPPTITLKITGNDIRWSRKHKDAGWNEKEGFYRPSCHCAATRAARRIKGFELAESAAYSVWPMDEAKSSLATYSSGDLFAFIRAFDGRQPVKPVTIKLTKVTP